MKQALKEISTCHTRTGSKAAHGSLQLYCLDFVDCSLLGAPRLQFRHNGLIHSLQGGPYKAQPYWWCATPRLLPYSTSAKTRLPPGCCCPVSGRSWQPKPTSSRHRASKSQLKSSLRPASQEQTPYGLPPLHPTS